MRFARTMGRMGRSHLYNVYMHIGVVRLNNALSVSELSQYHQSDDADDAADADAELFFSD